MTSHLIFSTSGVQTNWELANGNQYEGDHLLRHLAVCRKEGKCAEIGVIFPPKYNAENVEINPSELDWWTVINY